MHSCRLLVFCSWHVSYIHLFFAVSALVLILLSNLFIVYLFLTHITLIEKSQQYPTAILVAISSVQPPATSSASPLQQQQPPPPDMSFPSTLQGFLKSDKPPRYRTTSETASAGSWAPSHISEVGCLPLFQT